MSHKAEVSQLNSYFNRLDGVVKQERAHAMRQERSEGIAPAVLKHRHAAKTPSLRASDGDDGKWGEEGEGASEARHDDHQAEEDSDEDGMEEHADDGMEESEEEGHEREEEEKARVQKQGKRQAEKQGQSSISTLNQYFDKQAKRIKDHMVTRTTQMTAKQADADLNSYFDSLEVHTGKEGKMHQLENKVVLLTKEVKKLKAPVESIRGSAAKTSSAVRSIRGDAAATKHAVEGLASEDKKILAHEESEDVQAARRSHKPIHDGNNPPLHVKGLPPGWRAYEDEDTKHPYYYNAKSDLSTWTSPVGKRVSVKGMRKGWEAMRTKQGETYFVDEATGKATWQDPEVGPGAKLLQLMKGVDNSRRESHAEWVQHNRKVALHEDHGVYGHEWPRSQWADKRWMSFLSDSNAGGMGSLETEAQQLERGGKGSDHAPIRRASSSSY
uniref:WW domain-containing protein n=1 Tax=Hemiselmis andersenii TaxID=464988 RepID=A0A6U2ES89_HEMAN